MTDPDWPEPPPPTDADALRSGLRLIGGDGGTGLAFPFLTKSLGSACRLLRDAPAREFLIGKGPLEWNEMRSGVELNRKPLDVAAGLQFRELAELHVISTQGNKPSKRVVFGKDTVQEAIFLVSLESRYHPVQDYLLANRAEPCGAIERIAHDCLHVTADLDVSMIRKWAISCVARAMIPGCKVDTVLVLVGPGGIAKSTFLETMASSEFFRDTKMDMKSKDRFQQLHAPWIYEWGELASINGANQEDVKAFITSRNDEFRAPYTPESSPHPRSVVIVGSTNNRNFLRYEADDSDRRFWPIEVSKDIDIGLAEKLRDAFWAEAFIAFMASEPWHFARGSQEAKDLSEIHADHAEIDPWEPAIEAWLGTDDGAAEVTVSRALLVGLKLTLDRTDGAAAVRMGRILKRLKWEPMSRKMNGGFRTRKWRKIATLPPNPQGDSF